LLLTIATGNAIIIIPVNMVKNAIILPIVNNGYSSPYPTVVIVINAHYIEAGILVNGENDVESLSTVYIFSSLFYTPSSA